MKLSLINNFYITYYNQRDVEKEVENNNRINIVTDMDVNFFFLQMGKMTALIFLVHIL